jgi:hypothetical protein
MMESPMRPLAALAFLACAAAAPVTVPAPTNIVDPAALERLRHNGGLTLQWIDWDRRGRLRVSETGRRIHLSGAQAARRGAGRLTMDGDVVEIGPRGFTFQGRIAIVDTPDPGRNCIRDGSYEFRITGRRRYWRLQQMEQCDGLTDYVDIYF